MAKSKKYLEEKAKYFEDLLRHRSALAARDPESIMSSAELEETRRLLRESKRLGIREGEYLAAIHGGRK